MREKDDSATRRNWGLGHVAKGDQRRDRSRKRYLMRRRSWDERWLCAWAVKEFAWVDEAKSCNLEFFENVLV